MVVVLTTFRTDTLPTPIKVIKYLVAKQLDLQKSIFLRAIFSVLFFLFIGAGIAVKGPLVL